MAPEKPEQDRRSKLLQDLESLEGLLQESEELIPTLERVIPAAKGPATTIPTLDKPVAAADAGADTPKVSPAETNTTADDDYDYSLEFLIQDVIDEFMPRIEADLRQRLLTMDYDMLRRLLNSRAGR